MSAPVDVLAVLDRLIGSARTMAGLSGDPLLRENLRDGEKARDAVAELIEAAKRANGDHSAPHDCYATGPLTGDPVRDLVSCPGCELAAAIASVQGVKS